jgi:hypothetical protein
MFIFLRCLFGDFVSALRPKLASLMWALRSLSLLVEASRESKKNEK